MAYADLFLVKDLDTDVPLTKGTEIMEGLLLTQYKSSPNLIAYISAFTDEMDLIFEQLSRVHLGRTLEYATGNQLNVIGRILNQERNIELSPLWFGFEGATGVAGMAGESNPGIGGIFRSEDEVGFTITPLSDNVYRRVLKTKAMLHGLSFNKIAARVFLYEVVISLLGYVPQTLAVEELAGRHVQLTLATSEVTQSNILLINYMARYFIPLGAKFTIVQL